MSCERMERRDFVRRVPAWAAGLAGLSSLTSCAGTPYVTPTIRPEGLAVSLGALGAGDGAFVQAPGMERPLYLRRSEEGEWIALLASCTHRGCQPEPLGERLVCPCHGSEFALDGAVLEGPAEMPLTRYPVVQEGDHLIVGIERDES